MNCEGPVDVGWRPNWASHTGAVQATSETPLPDIRGPARKSGLAITYIVGKGWVKIPYLTLLFFLF